MAEVLAACAIPCLTRYNPAVSPSTRQKYWLFWHLLSPRLHNGVQPSGFPPARLFSTERSRADTSAANHATAVLGGFGVYASPLTGFSPAKKEKNANLLVSSVSN